MAQIESKKQNITKSVNLFLGRCHNYLQKAGSVYVVSDTDAHIFSDLDPLSYQMMLLQVKQIPNLVPHNCCLQPATVEKISRIWKSTGVNIV